MISGKGEKAFCAGGDIVSLYKARGTEVNRNFFAQEYIVDNGLATLAEHGSTQIAIWNGITMGGGVGVSAHAPIRVATNNSVYAMPETGIGFFPDVGGSYFLARVKQNVSLGLFLGVTGHRLKGKDLLNWGIATHFIEQEKIDQLYLDLKAGVNKSSNFESISGIVDNLSTHGEEAKEVPNQTEIEYCFKPDSIVDTWDRLEKVAEGGVEGLNPEFGQKTLKTLSRFSPISMAVSFEEIVRGQHLTLQEAFIMEYKISQGFMNHPEFFEGVRALLIDKDNAPKWSHKHVRDVTKDDIDFFFNRPEELNLDIMGDFAKAISG